MSLILSILVYQDRRHRLRLRPVCVYLVTWHPNVSHCNNNNKQTDKKNKKNQRLSLRSFLLSSYFLIWKESAVDLFFSSAFVVSAPSVFGKL